MGLTQKPEEGDVSKYIVICGSRTFSNKEMIENIIHDLICGPGGDRLIFAQGGARGADSLVKEICADYDAPCMGFPADWDQYGKQAGMIRNQTMIDSCQPAHVYAFIDKPLYKSRGAENCVFYALSHGFPVTIYSEENKR